MTTYTVTSKAKEFTLVARFASKAAKIEYLKNAQKELRDTVEKFAAQHSGQVIVGKEDLWLNSSLQIQTTPALAEQLRKVKGISDVSEPRKLTPDSKPRPPSL